MKITVVAALSAFIICLSFTFAVAQDNGEEEWASANAAFQNGNYKEAVKLYRQFLSSFPESTHIEAAHFLIGDSYKNNLTSEPQNRLRNAISAYELALSTFPESGRAPKAAENLALTYIRRGFIQDAIIQLRRARENHPDAANSEKLLLLLSNSYFSMDDFAQANLHLQTFLNEFPDSAATAEARLKLALSRHSLQLHSQAVPLFKLITEEDPALLQENPIYYYHMAESLLFSGNYQEAEKYLQQIIEDPVLIQLQPHAILRLGDTYRMMANAATGEAKGTYQRSAMSQYLQLYIRGEPKTLLYQALFRAVQVTDEAGLDLAEDYQLESAESLLHSILEESRDADTNVLALTVLAQHHRHHGRIIPALDTYKRAMIEYFGTPLTTGIRTEFRRYAQDNMRLAFANKNYAQTVNIFLGYIQDLELTEEDRLMLGVSFTRVRLFEQAKVYFDVLLATGIESDIRRTIMLETLKIHMFRQQYEEAQATIETILGLSPLPRERELTLFYQQQIWFSQKRVIELRNLYMENKQNWDTHLLRASLLYKLGALEFLEKNFANSEFYLGSFFRDFPLGLIDESPVAEMVVAAALTFADLHFINERYDQATRYYDYYLFYSPSGSPLDWALLQTARSRKEMGQFLLSQRYLQEFIDNYPGSYLMQQALNLKTELELLQ